MNTVAEKSVEILDVIVDLQSIEAENIAHANAEIPNVRNRFTRKMMEALKLEAERRCMLHGIIADSLEEAVNLSPDELNAFSTHLNKIIEAEEKALSLAKTAFEKIEVPISRFLIAYLIDGTKKENDRLKILEDELKTASIPTSITSKTFGKVNVGF